MNEKKLTTKERIMEESLKLFSISGFEGVTIRDIADAVGIRNSSLYKHFSSKQEIFDAIVEKAKLVYKEKVASVVSDMKQEKDGLNTTIKMFLFQTSEPWIIMFRQLLLIEKFRNQEIAKLYKEFFVDGPINTQMQIFQSLIDAGMMKKGNTKVYALELYGPFYMYHFVDENQEELMELFQTHYAYFWNHYSIKSDAGSDNTVFKEE